VIVLCKGNFPLGVNGERGKGKIGSLVDPILVQDGMGGQK